MRMTVSFTLSDVMVGLVNRVTQEPQVEPMTLAISVSPDGTAVLRLVDHAQSSTALISFTLPPQVLLALTGVVQCQLSVSKIHDMSAFNSEEDDE